MARKTKRVNHNKRAKKSKPNSTRDWTGILIGALVDLLIGAVLLIIGKMME